jgi:predicted nuclease with TOPRIM domain
LEVGLATERSRVGDLETRIEELEAQIHGLEKGMKKSEKERSRLEGEKESLEKEKQSLEKQLKEEKKKKTVKSAATGAGSEKENYLPEDVQTKAKKRQRDESDAEEVVERVSKKVCTLLCSMD